MNGHRNGLLEQYLEKVLLVQMAERQRGREELFRSAINYLNTADPQQRFSEPIVTIISTNISAKTSFDFAAARNVFSVMERYVINLLDCPWKQEFRKITMYSGFYKTQIEPTLKDAWKLLLMVGYEKVGMCLELKFMPDASRLHNVAFEFYLASLECLIYKDVFQQISSLGFTMMDYHQCRSSTSSSSNRLFKALSKFRVSETRDDRESGEIKASSRVLYYSSKLQSSQNPEYEAKAGSDVRVGGTQSGSSQQQMGSLSKVVQLPEPEKGGDGCETRSESIEAMLQEITPEMISDVNIRRHILTRLSGRPHSAKSHASLPPPQVQRESATRPHTEPLLTPKQSKPDVAFTSNIKPYSEPLAIPKQTKIVVTDKRPFTEPLLVPKHPPNGVRSALDTRPFTEPLLIPKYPPNGVRSASDTRPFTEPLLIPKLPKTGVTPALDTRPFTEPLLIPKHPQTGMKSALDSRPFTEPLLIPNQQKTGVTSALDAQLLKERPLFLKQHEGENTVVPNMRPYTEPLVDPKQKLTLASDPRPWTEPLSIPIQEQVSSKRSSKSKEPILPHWRCE